MKAIILSCGPSVTQFDPTTAADALVIGINRIPSTYRCDYWVFGDWWVYIQNAPIGSPSLCIPESQRFYLTHNVGTDVAERFKAETGVHWEEMINPLPTDTQLCFSFCAALLLVGHLGATELDVYGADMKGKADWDGTIPHQSYREDDRWVKERKRVDIIVRWLEAKGVRVQWHTSH